MTLPIVINCILIAIRLVYFLAHEFVYSDVCNFLLRSLVELFFSCFLICEDTK